MFLTSLAVNCIGVLWKKIRWPKVAKTTDKKALQGLCKVLL